MGISARLQLDPRIDPLPALHALLDLPLRLEGEGRRALVVLDEFQDLAKVREMDAILRSHIQFHGEVASYVFSGSEAGLMAQLFEAKDAPLYGQAVPLRLGRLAVGDLAAYVLDRFRGTEREVGDALGPMLAVAAGHPQRAMLLAHHLWEVVPAGEAATHASWQRAFAAALAQLEPELDAHWQRLTTVEQKTLRAVVAGDGSPYRTAVLERLDLQKASAQQALRNLAGRGEVERDDRRYRLVDPLFAVWVERLATSRE
jgi:uncharacterized protein